MAEPGGDSNGAHSAPEKLVSNSFLWGHDKPPRPDFSDIKMSGNNMGECLFIDSSTDPMDG